MRKVKAQTVRRHQRSLLLHMIAQHQLQRLLQQMGRAVIPAGIRAPCAVHLQGHQISRLDQAGIHMSHMAHLAAQEPDGVFHNEHRIAAEDRSLISLLPAHGGIKRRLFHEDGTHLAFRQSFRQFRIRRQHRHLRRLLQTVIAHELRRHGGVDLIIDRGIRAHVIGHLMGLLRQTPLLFHTRPEAVLIDIITFFLQDLFCQIQRESIGIVQFKCIRAGQGLFPRRLHGLFQLSQDAQSLINGPVELVLFLRQHLENKVSLLLQLRITVSGALNHGLGKLRQKFSLDTQQTPVTGRTADQAAKYIAPSCICGHDAVGDHKSRRTDMIRNQADGHILFLILLIIAAGIFAYLIPKGAHGIHVKNGIHVLHRHCQALQPHAGVDILLSQFCIMIVPVIVKLGKDIVPDLHIAVAVAAHRTVRAAASVCLSPVIINLRTGTAGTGSVLPEIVFLAETEDPLCRDPDLFVPDLECLVILQID